MQIFRLNAKKKNVNTIKIKSGDVFFLISFYSFKAIQCNANETKRS